MSPLDPTLRLALGRTLLTVAGIKSFAEVTIHDLAAAMGRPIESLCPATIADAVDCAEESFDRALAEGLAPPDRTALVRDRLFDVAMRRFEAMEPHRVALLAIDKSMERDPAAQAAQHGRSVRSARWILALAGLEADGLAGAARAQGLAFILAQARAAWRRETSGDFARTMAALDQALRRAEETFGRLAGFDGKGAASPPAPAAGGSAD